MADIATAKLLDEEARQAQEHRERIKIVVHTIEELMLANDFTMGDFLEVFNLFTERANRVFSETKIQKIKDTYERT